MLSWAREGHVPVRGPPSIRLSVRLASFAWRKSQRRFQMPRRSHSSAHRTPEPPACGRGISSGASPGTSVPPPSLPPSLPRAHGVEPAATGRPGRSPGVLQALRLHLRGSFLFSASGCLVSLNFGFSAYRPECPFCFVSGLLVCLCDTTSLLCFLFLFFEVLSPCYFYLHLSDGQ